MDRSWIARVMKDDRFEIVPNPGGGDCLFYVISQASRYSVAQIREFVSRLVTEEEFKIKKQMYESAVADLKRITDTVKRKSSDAKRLRECIADITDYSWIARINNLAEYREYVCRPRTSWGDAETVGHLERIFSCKMLFFDRKRPEMGFTYSFPSSAKERYIMVNYSEGCHFELVTFDGYKVFTLDTLPPSVANLFAIRRSA
jgi:hypothetical protein